MGYREDLSYEKKEAEIPYIHIETKGMGEALDLVLFAIRDAMSFWGHAKATGIEPPVAKPEAVKTGSEQPSGFLVKQGLFAAGAAPRTRERELEERVCKLEAQVAYQKIDSPEGGAALPNREKALAVQCQHVVYTLRVTDREASRML